MKYSSKIVSSLLASALLLGFSGCGEGSEGDTTTSMNGITNNEAKEIDIPSVSFSGVLQDKYGDAIASHEVCVADKCSKTDANGLFVVKDIGVVSGIAVGATATVNVDGQGGTTVTLVTSDVKDTSGNVSHLGLTATILVDKYLAAVYDDVAGQSYYTELNNKTISAGVIQLPQLGATVSGRFENGATGESVTASMAYLTMQNDGITATAAEGEEVASVTGTTYTIISNKEKIFTADINTTTGMFTATGLPYLTNLDVKVSGYQWTTTGPVATLDNSIGYSIGDVALTKDAVMGDQVAPNFISIANSVGDGDATLANFALDGAWGDVTSGAVTATSAALPTNFIAPVNTITLNFSEKLNTSTIDNDTIKYVTSMTDEAYTTYKDIAVLTDKQNSNDARLSPLYETVLLEEDNVRNYLTVNGDTNATTAGFVSLYNNYLSAVKAFVADINGTSDKSLASGTSSIPVYTFRSADANTSLDRTATNLDANTLVTLAAINVNRGTTATIYNLLATVATETGIELQTKKDYFTSLAATMYTNHAVTSTDTSVDNVITITLASVLPANNVVTIGLKTFDITDISGNILSNTHTLNGGGADNLNVAGYITEIDVGTGE